LIGTYSLSSKNHKKLETQPVSYLEIAKRGGDGMFATGIMSRTFNRMGNGYLGRADGGSASYRHGLFGK
jgi:hypothetical protein